MPKRTNSIRSYCEMVSRKVEKGTCFRELSSKANMGLPVQFMKKKKKNMEKARVDDSREANKNYIDM